MIVKTSEELAKQAKIKENIFRKNVTEDNVKRRQKPELL